MSGPLSDPLAVLDKRPPPGKPRDYDFPAFERLRLENGLTLIRSHVPGRPLLQAQLVLRGDAGGGAVSEPPEQAGVTVLAARALSEGTARRDAVAFVEAAERLGAGMAASAGWDSLSLQLEVPRNHLPDAMRLFAEMALEPSFPAREVERLRDERLNDLRQVMADAARRAEKAFPEVVYAEGAAYARPPGGVAETVAPLDRDVLEQRYAQILRPQACTLIVCGDLAGLALDDIVAAAFGQWTDQGAPLPAAAAAPDSPATRRRVVLIDRPAAPQSEVRVGHVGTARRITGFHALSVMNALLGGLFNSRLNRLLREQRGVTYGVNSSFDMRRAAGPFVVRCAVESEATALAVADILAELERVRQAPVERAELRDARDYLVGVFPLRFETSAQVAGALAGLVTHELPDDELDRYRPAVASVSAEAVLEAARRHLQPERASIVIVGDTARFADAIDEAGYGEVEIVRDEGFGGDAPAD